MLYTWKSGAAQHPEDTVLQFFTDFIKKSGVLSLSGNDLKVVAQTVPDMSVQVTAGRGYIKGSGNAYPIRQPTGDVINVPIQSNSSGYSRIDTVVSYIDVSATPNNPASNVAKAVAVQGTPAASPSAPDDTAILAAIGSSNPFDRYANVQVDSGVTSIVSGKITDVRSIVGFLSDLNSLNNQGSYAEDVGSTDAYAVTLLSVPTVYVNGMELKFKANTTNTGPATINVNGLGAKTIKKSVSADLEDGDIKSGQIISVAYDGTNFQMLSTTADEGVTTLVDASSVNIDSLLSKNFVWTLGAAGRILTFSNLKNGRPIYLETIQDATGGRTIGTFPSIPFTFVTGDVDTTNDRITVNKNIKTGTPIIFSSTGAVPTGLTAGTVYYAINYSSIIISVATSLANAQAGTKVDLTAVGSGTHTVACQIRWGGGSSPSFSTGKYIIDSFLFLPMDIANGDLRGYATGDSI